MDRRKKKTREAIFRAFRKLLEEKHFKNITVQEIIEEADIGRSTFYAHFETKDELLKAMCTDIFSHVFSTELIIEKTHDFSNANNSLASKITHILYHLKDTEKDLIGILSSESGELFMQYFREYLLEMFSIYLTEMKFNAPDNFVLNHLAGSFSEAVKWWVKNKMKETPEEIAEYFMAVLMK